MHVHVQVIKPPVRSWVAHDVSGLLLLRVKGLPAISAAAGSFLLGSGLIDLHRPAFVVGAVEAIDCRLSFGITRHFDEAKALASACVTIGNQLDGFHGSSCREFIRKILLGR